MAFILAMSFILVPFAGTAIFSLIGAVGKSVDDDAAEIRGRLARDDADRLQQSVAAIRAELAIVRNAQNSGTAQMDYAPLFEMFLKLRTDEAESNNHALAREYGSVGLSQAKVAFGVSLAAAGVGFAVIIAGAVSAFFLTATQAAVPVGAGSIISAISALFFSQASQTRSLMANLLDEEQANRRFDESLTLARDIKDPTIQSRLQALLSLNFANVEEKKELYNLVIATPFHSKTNSAIEEQGA